MPGGLDAQGVYRYAEDDVVTDPTFSAFLNRLSSSVSTQLASARPPMPFMSRVKSSVPASTPTALTAQKFETLEVNRATAGSIAYSTTTGGFTMAKTGLVTVSAAWLLARATSPEYFRKGIRRTRDGSSTYLRTDYSWLSAGGKNSHSIAATVPVVAGDVITIMCAASVGIQILHLDTGSDADTQGPGTWVEIGYLEIG